MLTKSYKSHTLTTKFPDIVTEKNNGETTVTLYIFSLFFFKNDCFNVYSNHNS